MCGRFVLATSTDDLQREFEVEHLVNPAPAPSWNVAPTDPVAMVMERRAGSAADGPFGTRGVRELRTARWGLVPHWATDRSIGTKMINARSETVASKPAFRAAAERRRCLIPANGYYEWSGSGRTRAPFYLHDAHDAVLAMAGLYEIWRDPALSEDHPDHLLRTVTVITRSAPDSLGHIHDRCPVAVPRDVRSDWLDCSRPDGPSATELLAAIPPPRLVPRQVGAAVGNVRNNDPSLIEPVDAVPDALF